MEASHKGHLECVKLLLQRAADLHVVDKFGLSATHLACIAGRYDGRYYASNGCC
jgi:ankyrin repeat protein